MSATAIFSKQSAICLSELIEYPQKGARRQILFEDASCQFVLMSLGAGAAIAEHTAPRNAILSTIEGRGSLVLESREIALEPGVLAFIPARSHHSLKATTDLSMLIVLTEKVTHPTS